MVLLRLVMQALDRQPALRELLGPAPDIEQAKFLAPVQPPAGGAAVLQLRLQAQGLRVAFEVKQGERAVVRGQLGPSPAPGKVQTP